MQLGALWLAAAVIEVDLPAPALDQWFYPFNTDPCCKPTAAVFGSLTATGFDPSFDNRDGQMLVGFDTAPPVPAGLGPGAYGVSWAALTLTVESNQTFGYDPTPDPWQSWLPPDDPAFVPDPDPGRAVELFGAGFRYGFTASTFPEGGPFCDGCSCLPPNSCNALRSVYAADFAAGCALRDVSNNFFGAFDPVPFAVGAAPGLAQGGLVPADTEMTFVIDVTDPCVQGYLRQALDAGTLDLVVASIFPAEQQQAGTFPKFYCKEHILVQFGIVSAARLEMTVTTGAPGDLDGSGTVNVVDFLALLQAWGPCPVPCPPTCPADLDHDCNVGIVDFLALLQNWG